MMLLALLVLHVASGQFCAPETDCWQYKIKLEGQTCKGGGGYDKLLQNLLDTVHACKIGAQKIQPACDNPGTDKCDANIFGGRTTKLEQINSDNAPAGCFMARTDRAGTKGPWRLFFNVNPTNKAQENSVPICGYRAATRFFENGISEEYSVKMNDYFAKDSDLVECEKPQSRIWRNCRVKAGVKNIKNFWFYLRGDMDWAYHGRSVEASVDVSNYLMYGIVGVGAVALVTVLLSWKRPDTTSEYESLEAQV